MGIISGIAQARGASRQADAIEAGNEAQIALAREALGLYRPQIAAGDTARNAQLAALGLGGGGGGISYGNVGNASYGYGGSSGGAPQFAPDGRGGFTFTGYSQAGPQPETGGLSPQDQQYQNFENSGFYRAAREGFDVDREYIDGGMSRGNLFSGARLRALDDRARQRASGAYGQYYNALAGLSGAGQVATQGSAGILNNAGAQSANAFQQIGQAQASRARGIGNAVQGGLETVGNAIFGGF